MKLTILRRPLIMKACAISLVVLAALPFTAPFATLDIADIFGAGGLHQIATATGAQLSTPQQDDNADDAAVAEGVSQRVKPAVLSGLTPFASATSAFFRPETPDASFTPGALNVPRHDAFARPDVLRL
jgi:hypothetical protein